MSLAALTLEDGTFEPLLHRLATRAARLGSALVGGADARALIVAEPTATR
jgi:hypothetical protein